MQLQRGITLWVLRSVVVVAFVVPIIGYGYLIETGTLESATHTVQDNLILYSLFIIFLKLISIVYPPLPGSLWTAGSIPLVGWELAYLMDLLGSSIGATAAFFLGKKYGRALVRVLVGETILSRLERLKIKPNRQVEAAFFSRIAAGGIFSDGLAWGASLVGFRWRSFIIGYVLSHVLTSAPVFYMIGSSIQLDSWHIIAVVSLVMIGVLYYFRGRYFE